MTKAPTPTMIGIFGLGLIGTALASRLIPAGFEVIGTDPDPAGGQRLQALGGEGAAPERVWQADVILSAVFDTKQLAALIEAAPQGKGQPLVSLSTCDPDLMPGVAEAARAKGYDLVEAPISGTSKDLADGDAILMVAGDPAVAERLRPLFDAVARAHFHVGEIGNGNKAKLAINLVLALNRAALAEGLVFAQAIGLEPGAFLELAKESAAASKVMGSKGPKMVAREFSPLGRITQCAKDADLISEAGLRAGQGLPLVERYREIVADSLAQGEGDLDNSGVLLAIERARILKR